MKKKLVVKELYEDLRDVLELEVLGGIDGFFKPIEHSRIQKPGLALAGFVEHLHPERVQVLGETEISYLRSIGDAEGAQRVSRLFSMNLSCFVVTKGLDVPGYMVDAANRYSTVLFRSPKVSSECIEVITDYLEDRLSPEVSLHGVLLDVFGVGVLLTGESGIGKSECALDLVYRGHRLVSDDIVIVKRRRDVLWGTAPLRIQHLMEVRGLGIVDIKDLFGVSSIRDRKRVDLVVELLRWDGKQHAERIQFAEKTTRILGIDVPCIGIPVSPGRNITLLIEIAAKLFLLKRSGLGSPFPEQLFFGEEVNGRGVE